MGQTPKYLHDYKRINQKIKINRPQNLMRKIRSTSARIGHSILFHL